VSEVTAVTTQNHEED